MPEQEKRAIPAGAAAELAPEKQATPAAEGPASISPLIIIPPVLISAVMALLLGLVYGVTKEPIAQARLKEKREKLQAVMPAFDNDPVGTQAVLSGAEGKAGYVVNYRGEQDGQVVGYGVQSAVGSGYSGYFSLIFGVEPDGTITAVQVLESAETPGLGSKAAQAPFIDQFKGKKFGEFNFKVKKDGGEIDAITGATITSRAVCEAVSQGLDAWQKSAEEPPAAAELEPATPESGGAPDESTGTATTPAADPEPPQEAGHGS